MRLLEFAQEQSESLGLAISVSRAASANDLVSINHVETLPSQAYELRVDDNGIVVSAFDDAGALYALHTSRQLFSQFGSRLPKLFVEDRPAFPNRGYMLDVSRGKIPKIDELKGLISKLAALKINHVQLYMENAFAYSAHPEAWRDASPLTSSDIVDLDKFCAERCVELVPNQNSFGHMERWLRLDGYRHLAETPDGYLRADKSKTDHGMVMRPDQKTLDFLDGLYGELLPNFRSGLFNVGCDETYELGQGFSERACAERGKINVYVDFLKKINALVLKHRRKMMFWADMLLREPELMSELPRDVIALNWGYGATHPFDEQGRVLAEAGIEFYVCPGTSSWNSLTGNTSNAIKNIRSATESGLRHGASGFLLTDWGDNGGFEYPPISYLPILAGACSAWTGEPLSDEMIIQGVDRIFGGQEECGLGKWLYEFGNVPNLLEGKRDATQIFQRLLAWDARRSPPYLEGARKSGLVKAIETFDVSQNEISRLRIDASDASLIKAELRSDLDMARLAALMGIARLENAMDKKKGEFVEALNEIIPVHRDLWLARNRPGGLERTLKPLLDTLEHLKRS